MRHLILIAFALLAALPTFAGNRVDSVYRCLDAAIEASDAYVAKREERIGKLMARLGGETDAERRFNTLFGLYKEYRAFVNDSALKYIEMASTAAAGMGDLAAAYRCKALKAFQCSTSGLYVESQDILAGIDKKALAGDDLALYYYACHHLFDQLNYYSKVDGLKEEYLAKSEAYADSLLDVADRNSPLFLQVMDCRMFDRGDYRAALRYNDEWLDQVGDDTPDFAIVAFYRHLDCKMLGDDDEWNYWLAMSALSDVRNATMDQGSMWELANTCYTAGDNERAYRYIDFAYKCADKFHTKVRSEQILPAFSTINHIYQTSIAETNRDLRVLLAVVSLSALVILASLVYVNKQRGRLSAARNELSDKNAQLERLNAEMKETLDDLDRSNRQLTETGRALSDAITSLDESSRVKEKYIGLFLRQCSMYIDKMDNLRKEVFALLKNRRFGEIHELTKPYGFRNKEQEELFEIFDSTFIRLFPTFVDEFNRLLKPEFRIQLSGNSKLNTDIRIFALIRLGIDDSSKIAEFLNYSVNTIYNYRARIKNGALCNRDEFEDLVKEIGLPQRGA